jgi:hypothetical protein
MKRIIVVAALALIAVPATDVGATDAWRSNTFRSPTGNIACRANPYAGHVKYMTENDGYVLFVGLHGRAIRGYDYTVDVTYAAPVLRYGDSWVSASGVFKCDSFRTGMRCRNVYSGHGFFLSRTAGRRW